MIFYFVPNAKVRLRDVWVGALITGLLWKGALEGFSWYMSDMTRFTRVNGSIAAVVAFLVWVYVRRSSCCTASSSPRRMRGCAAAGPTRRQPPPRQGFRR